LQGSLSRGFETLYDSILEIHARVELLLDFTEEHLIAQAATDLPERIRQIQEDLRTTMRSFEEGRLLRTGAKVVIVGRPNAGKSTLLNALLGCERAIVSEMPGTTRDSIEESVLIDGIQVRLVDTAGIRATQCPVELTGIRQTKARIEQADLILFVLSTAEPADQELIEEISIMPCDRTLFILNKQDIQIYDHLPLVEEFENIHISLKKAGTADAVKRLISTKLSSGIQGADMPHAVISERHKKLLERVEQEIAEALILAQEEDEEHLVLLASHFQSALESLGQVTGRNYTDELLNDIFSRFCIGK
jgi:tRNA modification GTPase